MMLCWIKFAKQWGFSPEITCLSVPAWDCLPYDRVSPRPELVGERLASLVALLDHKRSGGRIVLTTVSGIIQRLIPRKETNFYDQQVRIGDQLIHLLWRRAPCKWFSTRWICA